MRGKGGKRVQGAREESVNPEASTATAHNWKAVLGTGNMMKDDEEKSASTRKEWACTENPHNQVTACFQRQTIL